MNVSRYFLLIAIVWLLIGMGMGLYMGIICVSAQEGLGFRLL